MGFQNLPEIFGQLEVTIAENIELMQKNAAMSAEFQSFKDRTEGYFKKIQNGFGYKIIEEKDEAIMNLENDLEQKRQEFVAIKEENTILLEENKKIAEELLIIEEKVKNITMSKYPGSQTSKLSVQRTIDATQGSISPFGIKNTHSMEKTV